MPAGKSSQEAELRPSASMETDNSMKRQGCAAVAAACGIVVVNGRLVIAVGSIDLHMTSITRVFGRQAVGNPPARRHAKPSAAGNDVKLAPHRAHTPLQSHRYPEAHQARAQNEAGPASSAQLGDPDDNFILTSPFPQCFQVGASSTPGSDTSPLTRTTP
jgi:hypothetical protein